MVLLFPEAYASENDEMLSFMAQVDQQSHRLSVMRIEDQQLIPSIILNESLKKTAAGLTPGDKVMVKGKIIYQPLATSESQTSYSPIFIIESIQPISLKSLALAETSTVDQPNYDFLLKPRNYSPSSIPISTEVASAITITTAALLFESLTATPGTPEFKRDLGTGLIIFGGLMATGVFVYEELTNKKKDLSND